MKLSRLFLALATLAATIVPAAAADEFQLGGLAQGVPATVSYKFAGQPAIAVFVRGPANLIYAKVTADNGANWVEWTPIGTVGMKGSPSCVARTSAFIDCVARGTNDSIWWTVFDVKKVKWTGWLDLGGAAKNDPSLVATKEDGGTQVRIFMRGAKNHLYMNTLEGGDWSDWEDLDGTIGGQFSCAAVADLGAHCYDSSKGNVFQVMDITHQTGSDVVVEDLGGDINGKVSAVWAGNSMTLFGRGSNDALMINKWTGAWSGWTQTEQVIGSAPGCAIDGAGKAWCASVGANGAVQMNRS